MNNYKIKVNDEAESKETQELFFELGYKWEYKNLGKQICNEETIGFLYAEEDGSILSGAPDKFDFFYSDENKELTLPQLRDLVVLHRNDIHDANWVTEGDDQIYQDSNGKSFIFREQGWDELQRHEMRQAMWEKVKPKPQPTEPEQGLISGADALRALLYGNDVQVHESTYKKEIWFDLKKTKFTPSEILEEKVRDKPYKLTFRLKPSTIKLELEIPAPFEPKEGDLYWFITSRTEKGYSSRNHKFSHGNSGFQFGAWRTEEEIKQVVASLRGIKG